MAMANAELGLELGLGIPGYLLPPVVDERRGSRGGRRGYRPFLARVGVGVGVRGRGRGRGAARVRVRLRLRVRYRVRVRVRVRVS